MAVPAEAAPRILAVEYAQPVDRYDHRILGGLPDHGTLRIRLVPCAGCTAETRLFRLPETHVFEDVRPRLADVTGDGLPEVVVVETDIRRGASLAVYGPEGRIAATEPIGQTHRWLAPAGIGDFDGDGRVEIAYVDRPHLRRELVFVRLEGGALVERARRVGFSNHNIGDEVILSGTRDCGQGDELVLPDVQGRLVALGRDADFAGRPRDLGKASPTRLRAALACRD